MKELGKERNTNIELLRIISMIIIVLSHCVTHGGFLEQKFSALLVTSLLLRIGGKLGVTCFVLISAYYLVDSKFKIQNILKLYLQILLFAFISAVIKIFFAGSLDVTEIVKTMFAPIYGIYWFPTAYLGLYICFPWLNIIINNLEKDIIKVDVILTIVLSIISMLLPTSNFLFSNVVWFIYLYFIGASIKRIDWSYKKSTMILALFLSVGVMWISSLAMTYLGCLLNVNVLVNKAYYLSKMESPLMVIAGISMFCLFNNCKMEYHSIVNRLGKITFSVYLLHDNEINRTVIWNDIYKAYLFYNSGVLRFCMYAGVVIVSLFLIALFIDLIRLPVENKILNSKKILSICDKINSWYPASELYMPPPQSHLHELSEPPCR